MNFMATKPPLPQGYIKEINFLKNKIMALNEVKKSDIDEVNFDEKILLATHGINWFAIRTEKIWMQLKTAAERLPDDKVMQQSLKDWDEIRAEILKKTVEVLERFGNYVDGRDANDEIDNIVTEPSYDILYERYEPE